LNWSIVVDVSDVISPPCIAYRLVAKFEQVQDQNGEVEV
jgi:hypothetical protein